MRTTLIIRDDMKGGMVMYPYNQEYTWFTFKVSGSIDGLLIEWIDIKSFRYSMESLSIVSIDVVANIKEMLLMSVAGYEVTTRIITVDV